jgi:Leucine-rich repeat (LRR) protein
VVYLNGNPVQILYENSFQNVSCLSFWYSSSANSTSSRAVRVNPEYLDLSQQNIKILLSNTINGLFHTLYLSDNIISSFETDCFADLPKLREIDLSNNLIEALNFEHAFKTSLKAVTKLNFTDNKIASVEPSFFSKFPSLEHLDISDNFIDSIRSATFLSLFNLKSLNLWNNAIFNIELDGFQGLSSLVHLNLSLNLMYSLNMSLFKHVTSLKELDLSANELESIDSFNLRDLTRLDLSQNEIKSLDKATFGSLVSLETLSIGQNKIKFLNSSVKNLTKLKYLDLSMNNLSGIHNFEFDHMPSLEYLDVSDNKIEHLDANLANLYKLKAFKLKNTNSNLILSMNFSIFPNMEELDLSFNDLNDRLNLNHLKNLNKLTLNNINSTDFLFLSNLNGLVELSLDNNKLIQANLEDLTKIRSFSGLNCDIKSFFKLIYFGGDLTFLSISSNNFDTIPVIFNFFKLTYLDLSKNRINRIELPDKKDFFKVFNQLKYLNLNQTFTKQSSDVKFAFNLNLEQAILSGNQLKNFPSFCEYSDTFTDVLCKLNRLHFDSNRLKRIYSIDLIYLYNLKYLNLDNNEIGHIEPSSFINLYNLEALILSRNKLAVLNDSSLFNCLISLRYLSLKSNLISSIPARLLYNLAKLEVLDLSCNRIFSIETHGIYGLANLMDLHLNNNSEGLKMNNFSIVGLQSIQNIYISGIVISREDVKDAFIELNKQKNARNNLRSILNRRYFRSLNLISVGSEHLAECILYIYLIRFNIHFNLKSDSDINRFLGRCGQMELALFSKQHQFH